MASEVANGRPVALGEVKAMLFAWEVVVGKLFFS